jgi:hypothetical protein
VALVEREHVANAQAIREHFAGYRSHSTLLAGAVFVFTVGGLFYLAAQEILLA